MILLKEIVDFKILKTIFKKINPYQVDEVNRLRKVLKNRYFAN